MTLDQLREKAENATPGPWSKGGQNVWSSDTHAHIAKIALSRDAVFVAAFNPEVALALVEYVQANEDRRGSSVLHPGHKERTRRYMDARARLFGLLGEAK